MPVSPSKPLYLAILLGWALGASPARAVDHRIDPGGTLSLRQDLVLSGSDTLTIEASAGRRCSILGNDRSIRTTDGFRGQIVIRDCDIRALGDSDRAAIEVRASGAAHIAIEGSSFDECGGIRLFTLEQTSVSFSRNFIRASSRVPAVASVTDSRPAFHAEGYGGRGTKVFSGNRIDKSYADFQNAERWLIGGDRPSESNIITGLRAGIFATGRDILIRGNYISGVVRDRWSQIAALTAEGDRIIVEHNVIRHGHWTVRSLSAELRYNIIGDQHAHDFIITGSESGAKIHHNIFVKYNVSDAVNPVSGIHILYRAQRPNVEVYNNTLDGGGPAYGHYGPAVQVDDGAILLSLRSNAIFNFPLRSLGGSAAVRPGFGESKGDPGPARLGYADYNLFYNPDADARDNYGVSVSGLRERQHAGFGRNDVNPGGAKDEQVPPRLVGPLPTVFPFSEDDIRARKVSVCAILSHYRAVYTPAPGSPLIDAGDPRDGPGNDIGAVGAGQPSARDRFGRLCEGLPEDPPDMGWGEPPLDMPDMPGAGPEPDTSPPSEMEMLPPAGCSVLVHPKAVDLGQLTLMLLVLLLYLRRPPANR